MKSKNKIIFVERTAKTHNERMLTDEDYAKKHLTGSKESVAMQTNALKRLKGLMDRIKKEKVE